MIHDWQGAECKKHMDLGKDGNWFLDNGCKVLKANSQSQWLNIEEGTNNDYALGQRLIKRYICTWIIYLLILFIFFADLTRVK